MKNYMVRMVGNDIFDRSCSVKAESIEEAAKSLSHILESFGRLTIEQFVRVTIEEVREEEEL